MLQARGLLPAGEMKTITLEATEQAITLIGDSVDA